MTHKESKAYESIDSHRLACLSIQNLYSHHSILCWTFLTFSKPSCLSSFKTPFFKPPLNHCFAKIKRSSFTDAYHYFPGKVWLGNSSLEFVLDMQLFSSFFCLENFGWTKDDKVSLVHNKCSFECKTTICTWIIVEYCWFVYESSVLHLLIAKILVL